MPAQIFFGTTFPYYFSYSALGQKFFWGGSKNFFVYRILLNINMSILSDLEFENALDTYIRETLMKGIGPYKNSFEQYTMFKERAMQNWETLCKLKQILSGPLFEYKFVPKTELIEMFFYQTVDLKMAVAKKRMRDADPGIKHGFENIGNYGSDRYHHVGLSYTDHIAQKLVLNMPDAGNPYLEQAPNDEGFVKIASRSLMYNMFFRPGNRVEIFSLYGGAVNYDLQRIKPFFQDERRMAKMKMPFDVTEGIEYLRRYKGLNKQMEILLKRKFNVPINPKDIDDKTLVDLL